jgi:hypothetical protein
MIGGLSMSLKHLISRNLLRSATVLLLGVSGAAHASTLTYSSASVVDEKQVFVTGPSLVTDPKGGGFQIGAGQIQLQIGASTLPAWCLDLLDPLGTLATTLTISNLTTAGAGGGNPTITNTQIGEIGALMVHGNALVGTDPNASAAIQLAIWKVEYQDFSFDENIASLFYPGLPDLADLYYNDVIGGTWAPVTTVGLLSDSPGNQSLGFVTPIPVPGALPLFIGGLGLLGAVMARRKRKQGLSLAS